MRSPSSASPPAASIEIPAETTASVITPAEKGGEEGAAAAAPASISPPAAAVEALGSGAIVKLTVTAKSPLWRGVPGAWVKYWPQGETVIEAEELSMFAPEIVDAMIAALEGDALGNFKVTVYRLGEA